MSQLSGYYRTISVVRDLILNKSIQNNMRENIIFSLALNTEIDLLEFQKPFTTGPKEGQPMIPYSLVNSMLEFRNLTYFTKIFYVEDNIKKALLLTKNNVNNVKEVHLPFDKLFIDCDIKIDDWRVFGIHLLDLAQLRIKNKMSDISFESTKNFKQIKNDVIISAYCYNEKHNVYSRTLFALLESKWHVINDELPHMSEVGRQTLRVFIMNFIDFLNVPDVKTVVVERSQEENEKREKRGKPRLPAQVFIHVTGETKIYLNELSSGKSFNYSHKFWVRGHFRTLKSPRYKEQGSKKWILPYVKGKGILINKGYEVSK